MVERVEFFRNGRLAHVEPVERQVAVVTFHDAAAPRGAAAYYHVRATQQPEQRAQRPDERITYSSPDWLEFT